MNSVQRVAHRFVSSVANDLRDNTLTNIVSIPLGAARGGQVAYKAARTGFTMIQRNVATKTITGAAKGAAAGWVGGHGVVSVAQKVASIEKSFDNTRVGRAIDQGITKAENYLHRLIGGGSH